ncbi:type II toxin-antitoxin system RelE/ParE family toxin [Roseateles sp.]|uniref:type II toxin-antitoxin system RelE/ParE family toxin n=1 Tax=Roseateles TaxID=93681 RepID=UPI002F3FB4DF
MDNPTTLEWRPRAHLRYRLIIAEIARHNTLAAEELRRLIWKKLRFAMAFPKLYRASSRVDGIREIVVTANYLVPYRITSNSLEVLDVVHARRDWPNPPQLLPSMH